MTNRLKSVSYCCVLATISLCFTPIAFAQTYAFKTLYSFKDNGKDPSLAGTSLIVDAAGNLYGTSSWGGNDYRDCGFGCGTVFRVTKSGVLSVLHSFGAPPDGEIPTASLFRDAKGNLFGSTSRGGSAGCGIIFQITPSGAEKILYSFTCGTDGFQPSAVVLDSAGNIYGTSNDTAVGGIGLVFKINSGNTFRVLHNFCSLANCADGQNPLGGLTLDKSGNLYGITSLGGVNSVGTLFKVTPEGVETVLHDFGATPGDGMIPAYKLNRDQKGNLYSVTIHGGINDPDFESKGGALFEQSVSGGPDKVLYSFCSVLNCTDGFSPVGPVARDSAGNYYGSALGGLISGTDVIWEVTASGEETVLHRFGKFVLASGLVVDSAGNLYGTTAGGGTHGLGSVFKLTRVK